jgi:hypothetical protein
VSGIKFFAVALGIAAIFGAFGFANGFTVNGGANQADQLVIASGGADLLGCNGNVEVNPQAHFVNDSGWQFGNVEVDANPECATFDVQLVFTYNGDQVGAGSCSAELDNLGDATVDCSGLNLDVNDANDIHVLIDGELTTIIPTVPEDVP